MQRFLNRWTLPACLVLASAYVVPEAQARPDPDANPAWSGWFDSLREPHTGISCCSLADCRRTVSRIHDGHYEAMLGTRWITIPPDKVLEHEDNPTGEAVLCWSPAAGVLCFVRGPEG